MKFELLTPGEIELIHTSACRVLAETGVCFRSKRALEVLAGAGGEPDYSENRVRLPEALIEQALEKSTGRYRLWNRSGTRQMDLQDGQVRGHNVGGCARIYDAALNESRDATKHDLQRLTTVMDALDHIHVCRPAVYPQEFPTSVRDVYVTATILQYSDKPYGVSALSPANLTHILEVVSVIAGSMERLQAKPFIWGSVCPDSPLSYSQSTTDILVRYAELGLPVAVAPCPVCGSTSPVTLAGSLVQLNAEFLAALALVQTIHPGIDVKYTARPMPMNMRTGAGTFGAIEMGLMSAAIVQLAKRYRVCSDAYGLGTRSKGLDAQAAYEKALNGLLVALSGADLVAAAGLLEDALTSSAEQLVIDDDILGMIFRAVRGIDVTDDTLGIATIAQVGPSGSFLMEPHTLQHMRKEYFQPALIRLTEAAFRQGASTCSVQDAARDRVDAILKSHQPPELEDGILVEIDGILECAAQNLGGI